MEDKKRILKMIEEGKITAEEGIKLLDALESNVKKEIFDKEDEFFNLPKNNTLGKMFYVRVKSKDGERVSVNIPIEFIKILGGSASVCEEKLGNYDVDLDKIIKAIDSGFVGRIVEVDSEDGDKIIVEIA